MSTAETIKGLPLPAPGQIEYRPGFVSADTMQDINAPFSGISQGVHYSGPYHALNECSPQLLSAHQLSTEQELAIRALAEKIVPHVAIEWETYSVFVRCMGNPGISSVSKHTDGERDVRVLVEGHGSFWHFDDPAYLERYPEGLPLSAGDTIVLNNLCHRDQQLVHGVAIGRQRAIRLSYLFHFHHPKHYGND